jgi:succinate dehydrogenase/fumarate reductase flavoprotein subunit
MSTTHKFATDVLIIGGGHAALFAAIKAKRAGADVIVVDKSYAGKSGQSPYTDSLCIFDPKRHRMDKWLEGMAIVGEYVNNPAWSRVVFEGSLEVFEQVTAMGLKCHEYRGEVFRLGGEDGGLETVFHPKNFVPEQARKEALKLGVKIIDRVMISELIKEGDKVIGAVGFCAEEAQMYVFDAKATIMCAGAVGFKPNGWPIHNLTGDADAMAYRVGAEVLGKEFIDTHAGPAKTPAFIPFAKTMKKGAPPMFPGHPEAPPRVSFNAEGDAPKFSRQGLWLSNEFEVHAGRGPVSGNSPMGSNETFTGGASLGMACHKTEGIVAADDLSCATQIEGLYAAGDALGNMASGANYTVMGFAATHAMVSGNIAGENAAKYAVASVATKITDERIATAKEAIYAPLERKGGFAPRWVNQVLKNSLMPYFILYIKHEDRLKGALAYIEFMQSHMVPMLKAHDPHELRLAHETRNMILNAEMKLRSSMARKESRGSHYRDDYPQRNDDFLAWVKLKDDAGEMLVRVDPIPQELLPQDLLAKSYEERYPLRFPKEIDGVE